MIYVCWSIGQFYGIVQCIFVAPCPTPLLEIVVFPVYYMVMLKIGIVGLPNVGKSTLFKALTKQSVDIANYPFATIDPNIGVVAVPDERLGRLAAMAKSKKIVPAAIEFVDIAGLV